MAVLLLALILFLAGSVIVYAAGRSIRRNRQIRSTRVEQVAQVSFEPLERGVRASRWAGAAGDQLKRVLCFGMRNTWGVTSPGRKLLAYGLGAGVAAGLAATLLLKAPAVVALALAAVFFFLVPRLLVTVEQSRSEMAFVDLFPDAIDMITRMIRAGLPVTAAIRTVGAEAAPPVKDVFAAVGDQVDIGIPLENALANAGQHVELTDFRFFTVAVAMQHATGGNLATTLETLSEIIRKRRAMRLKARAVTAEVRMTAYVLAIIPFFVVGVLLAFSPSFLAPLIEDRRGNIIAGVAVLMLTLGFLSMRQMMRTALRI